VTTTADDSEPLPLRAAKLSPESRSADKVADHVKRALAEAPPLTNEQRTRLAELLRPVRCRPTKDGWVAP
jgi:hypothetical protein